MRDLRIINWVWGLVEAREQVMGVVAEVEEGGEVLGELPGPSGRLGVVNAWVDWV